MKLRVFLTIIAAFAFAWGCNKEASKSQKNSVDDKSAVPKASPKETPKDLSTANTKKPVPKTEIIDKFSVKLTTTKGDIIIDVNPKWAPIAAKRFHELTENGFYVNSPFFRVLEGFMAQAGINADPKLNKEWRSKKIKDDTVKESNKRGTVSFATAGPNSRTTQFFINFGDNTKLDRMGFAPFGKVRDMKTVEKLYSKYGEGAPRGNGPSQKRLQLEGKVYWEKEFPKLDYIKSAEFVD